ncbi:MAG TPA: response regulator [Pyrinomonadaceae bacterium]|nr:response regulator [Pyrinomonadaceae bacterium]HMP65594.1 response regulator [Pyrinomonadaceae bacterium]
MSKRKLLLADDSITIQKVVNLTFAEEGIEVVTVGDGDSALARIGEEWPDLVMADVNMPGASGYQICEAIRSDSATRDIPVILLVGSFEPFDEAEAARVGANAYLTKPFNSIRQLVAQVSELIEARPAPPAEEPSLNGIAMDSFDNETSEDVESLYDRSMSSDSETSGSDDLGFSDETFDDEMIETTYIDPRAETVEFGLETPASEAESLVQETDDPSLYESDAPQSLGVAGPESEPVPTADTMDESFSFPSVEDHEPPADAVSEERVQAEESLPSITEMPTEQFDVEQAGFAIAGPAPEREPAPVEDEDDGSAPAGVVADLPAVEEIFDDMSLLDLPPVGEDSSIRFVTPNEAEAAGSRERVVTVSPELMDAIVHRVVEHLSKKS